MTIFVQNAFTAGEISPLLGGRPELNSYRTGAAVLENFVILPHGGLTRRAGTKYVASTKSDEVAILVPFQFSTTDVYMLEFGNLYMRVFKDGDVVGAPYELVTPYTSAQLSELSFAQAGDFLFVDHPSHHPRQITRTADTSWSIDKQSLFDGPYDEIGLNENNNLGPFAEATLTASATTGSVTVTASGSGLTNFFVADDVDRVIRLYDTSGAVWGAGKITALNSDVQVQVDVFVDMPFATTGTTVWRLGSWSDQHGWPSHVRFHEQRLVHARTATYVNRVWGSQPNDFVNMSPTEPDGSVNDSHAYSYSLATGSIDEIRWLVSDRTLMCGTSNGPFSLGGADLETPITPLSIRAKHEDAIGCNTADPARVGKTTIYIRKGGTGVQAAKYSFQDGGFVTQDISNISEHLFRGGLTRITDAILPYYNVYGYGSTNNYVYCLTYFPEQGTLAWSHFAIGGTDAVVESVAVIPDPTDTFSQLWLIVKRTIDGVTKRYVEYMEAVFDINSVPDKDDAYFVDAGITRTGVATDTISGLSHLEGELVSILADGAVHPPQTVSGGQITLDYEASKVHVGLPCPCYFKSLPTEYITDQGSTQHRIKRIDHIYANIYNSMPGLQFGPDLDTLETIALRTTEDEMDDSVDLFTGSVDLPFDGAYSRDNEYVIYQENPVPLTIRSIGTELVVHGRN